MEWYQVLISCGVPTAVLGFLFWLFERRIDKREKEREKKQEQQLKHQAKLNDERKQHEILLIESTGAAIALGEATARAVQRIPDAHCNGDMHAALDYAVSVKHKQKELLTKLGVENLYDD